jgi:hypothetical protein
MFWPAHTDEEINKIKEQYLNALKSQDKSNAVYWGKLFYEYNSCFTIHQQNNIQLQIQNDILSHTK